VNPRAFFALIIAISGLLCCQADPAPLVHAHAHNDYEHHRPLLDALAHGFCGVEADVHLLNGKLLVAHDTKKARAARTLEALYLRPLRERIRANGGRVYRDGPTLLLLVDIKSAAEPTYAALRDLLSKYSEMLTRFSEGRTETNAVTVVLSGNRPQKMLAAETIRFAALDGRLEDIGSPAPSNLLPLLSDNWTKFCAWNGDGEMPEADRTKLHQFVVRAHHAHRQLRFWATPDKPALWTELRRAGVDWIGSDNLESLGQFLRTPTEGNDPNP
jgi:hypothetical protein